MSTNTLALGERAQTGERQVKRFVGASDRAQQAEKLLKAVAVRDSHVLITGESGTGKELAARTVHANSKRAAGPFVPVDCTTLNQQLFESQLFGHVKGAFTGAERDAMGFFRAADGGTLFLDEIGELDLALQAKLLRCIQERAIVPLGTSKPVAVNVRIVAATNRDLKAMVAEGKFREDLYYRINVVNVKLPALRERRDDIANLADFISARVAEVYEESAKQLSGDALEALANYNWPGNVRELANAIEHAYVLAGEEEMIGVHHLPESLQPQRLLRDSEEKPAAAVTMPAGPMTYEEMLKWLIAESLKANAGNQAAAARAIGVHRQRFYRLVEKYELQGLCA